MLSFDLGLWEPHSNFEAFSDSQNRYTCGIRIKQVFSHIHTSKWTCELNGNIRGTLTLVDETVEYVRDVRLPRHLMPSNYNVELTPIIEETDFTIPGKATITFVYDSASELSSFDRQKIYMHSKEIAINLSSVKVSVTTASDPTPRNIPIEAHEFDLDREFYIIRTDRSIADTTVQVYVEFTSQLNDKLVGFYRSKYTDVNTNNDVWLGTTQFQATDARRAFPCLDEPDIKATFDFSIGYKPPRTAYSNMPRKSTAAHPDSSFNSQGYMMDVFETSLKMSTYLGAFLVSDFTRVEADAALDFGILCVPSKTGQTEEAQDAGPYILKELEKYFNVPYPLPKTDMVALPDFKYGAMENW